MPNIIIDKYGGSSITSKEDIEKIKKITNDDKRRKIIVVSAPGIPPDKKHDKNYKKVTDLSILYSQTKDYSILEEISRIYAKIYPDFGEPKFVEKLETILGVNIYFCHPYHSWEKGTVENTNKHIRKYIPKGSNISKYSKKFIGSLEAKLNRRIMKVINFHTPDELVRNYRKREKRLRALRN